MKTTGLIVEYNPLHNGHLLHIQRAKEETRADIYIAIMSGNYVQRGEPALVDKWTRTQMALNAGIDLVIELPFLFATQNANVFADAAVHILKQLQADYLVFGTEDGNLENLKQVASFLQNNPQPPAAPNETYAQWIGQVIEKKCSLHLESPLNQPNQILGTQYLRAISMQEASIQPIAIKRVHADYHETSFTHQQIASATSIRNQLTSESAELSAIENYVPSAAYQQMLSYSSFITWDCLFPFLQMKVATTSRLELADHLLVCEGLESRIKKIVPYTSSFHECMTQLKTKRYTWTRLMRTLLHIALHTKKDWESFSHTQMPYLKVLGFNEKGRAFLHEKKKTTPLPFVHQPKNSSHPLMELEDRVDMLYTLLFPYEKRQQLMARRLQGPVRIYIDGNHTRYKE